MIKLGDYLGQLISEITMARVQADLETVRMAEMYANHELMKHMSVPRMRLQNVNLDIPMVVYETDEPPGRMSPRGGLRFGDYAKVYLKSIQKVLKERSIELSSEKMKQIEGTIKSEINSYYAPEYLRVDTNHIADLLTRSISKLEFFDPPLLEVIQKSARVDLINAKVGVPRVTVGVTSGEIKEADPESVVRFSVSVLEEGLEWTFIAGEDGESSARLVTE